MEDDVRCRVVVGLSRMVSGNDGQRVITVIK